MKLAVTIIVALVVGAVVGATWTSRQDEKEFALRAHWARALFRVAERRVGHERLIVEWRQEAQQPESTLVAVPEIDGRVPR